MPALDVMIIALKKLCRRQGKIRWARAEPKSDKETSFVRDILEHSVLMPGFCAFHDLRRDVPAV